MSEKSYTKNIHWFPGHMVKARRQIEQNLKLVDIAYVVLDSRIPYSSQNPLLSQILGQKPKLVILNKADLADPRMTRRWEDYFKSEGSGVLVLDSLHKNIKSAVVSASKGLLAAKFEKEKAKGMRPRAIRAMVLGIPNVGKSTFINNLVGRKATQTANRPGVTRDKQWVKVAGELELLDTPGVLWPKFEDQRVGMNLALTGAIKDSILPTDDVALYSALYLAENYSDALVSRYGLVLDINDATGVEILTEIGKNRKLLTRGGEVDYDRVCDLIIKEVRDLKLGRLSFETPDAV